MTQSLEISQNETVKGMTSLKGIIQLNFKKFNEYMNNLSNNSTSQHSEFLKYQNIIIINKNCDTYNLYLDFNDSDLFELFTNEEQTKSNVNRSILATTSIPYESSLDSGNNPFQSSVVHAILDDMTRVILDKPLNFFTEPNHKLHILEVFKLICDSFENSLTVYNEPIIVIPVQIRVMSKI